MKVTETKPVTTITAKTKPDTKKNGAELSKWWEAGTDTQLCGELLGTVEYLKTSQTYRQRQAAIYARLYGNMSLFSFIGSNMSKLDASTGLPMDRPTFNIIQSATDTLVSRISQSRPAPVFLTDNGDYKERNLAKKLNNFIQGEFFRTKAYDKTTMVLRDAMIMGTGCLKVYESQDCKVSLDRVLLSELFVDQNEGIYGEPRRLYQVKLVDRAVLMESFPKDKGMLKKAEKAFPDNSAESAKTVSDLVMVVEAWSLPSIPGADDGRHTIACSSGIIVDEKYTKDKFPFVFLHYSHRLLGFWSQGLAEQLMGTQMEINSLLYTISRAIKLVGVPRVFQEMGSKVTKATHNNDVGVIVEYKGTKPSYEVAECNAPELYQQLQRMIDYGYQQCGVSALQASSQKPMGLDSGEAIRTYDDISTDRFASLARKYDNLFVDLTYLMTDLAKDIAEREGEYTTVYPGKNGCSQVDLPDLDILKNDYIVQVFNQSSLPKDPAGRMQKITELMQAGVLSLREGRRLMDFPDLGQVETLANAAEERIYQALDKIVEDGEYMPPDPFVDLQLANETVVQYINLYSQCQLEEEKMEQLRTYFNQIQAIKQAAMPQMPAPGAPAPGAAAPAGGAAPIASPMPAPQSNILPFTNNQ